MSEAISEMTKRSLASVQATLQKAQQGGSLHELPLDAIVVVSNIRGEIDETTTEFGEFTDNIRQYAVQEPILVRPAKVEQGKYELIAGERRWRASRAAGKSTVPAIVKHVGDDELFMLQVIENIHRENLSQLKEAEALQEAMRRFGTLEFVAKKWNRSKAWVSERLQLLTLGPSASQLIEDGVTADVAVINSVNRTAKVDEAAGEALAQKVRVADKKRDVARAGLREVKKNPGKPKSRKSAKATIATDWGNAASELAALLASSMKAGSTRGDLRNQVTAIAAEADKRARTKLEKALQSAHAAGGQLANGWQAGLGKSLSVLAAQLDAAPATSAAGRGLVLKAFALGAMKQPYDFETIVVS